MLCTSLPVGRDKPCSPLCFSLHSNSPLDINIKGTMIRDLMNVAGFMIPDKNDIKETVNNQPDTGYVSVYERMTELVTMYNRSQHSNYDQLFKIMIKKADSTQNIILIIL